MSNFRASVLIGSAAANKVHYRYNLPKIGAGSYVDVFDVIQKEHIVLCFRALDHMHGAYISSDIGRNGILVNSQHPIHVQRFTAAHELGHYVLGHKPSVDKKILQRAPFPTDKYEEKGSDPEQERQADSFASAFLMPKWLIAQNLQKIGENKDYLKNDINRYQMSLRLGVSYTSFCWGLLAHDLITRHEAEKFVDIVPKDIKKRIVSEEILKINPWANVWLINEKSSGIKILGEKSDLFVLELEETPSTGYVWDYSKFTEGGLRLLSDEIIEENKGSLGSKIKRRAILTNDQLFTGTLPLCKKRPWNNDTTKSLSLNFSLKGKGRGFYNKIDIANAA